MVNVPVRGVDDAFAAIVNWIVAGPTPLVLPALSVIQLALLVATQSQSAAVVSETLPAPPPEPIGCPDAPREYVHGALEFVTPTIALAPSNESVVNVIGPLSPANVTLCPGSRMNL